MIYAVFSSFSGFLSHDLNDAYVFSQYVTSNGTIGIWKRIADNNAPREGAGRSTPQMISFGDSRSALVYSGQISNGDYCNDAYVISLSFNDKNVEIGTWTRTIDAPSARISPQMVSIGKSRGAFMFGGTTDGGNDISNDGYLFQFSTKSGRYDWTRLKDGPG